MAKLAPAAERMDRARELIESARSLPVPTEMGRRDFSYIAQVKDLMRQARDLIKFIPRTVGVSEAVKVRVAQIFHAAEDTERELLD